MHECPNCGMACDCDGEDLWQDPQGTFRIDCRCNCDDEDDEGEDYFDVDAEDLDEVDPQMPGWSP